MSSKGYLDLLWCFAFFQLMLVCNITKTSNEISSTNYNNNTIDDSFEILQENEPRETDFDDTKKFYRVNETQDVTDSQTEIPNSRMFPWDKNVTQAKDFQRAYCSRFCHGQVLVAPEASNECLDVECFPCDCNKPLCEFYETCCPDYYAPSTINISSDTTFVNSSETTNENPQSSDITNTTTSLHTGGSLDWKLFCESFGESSFLYIRSCPTNYTNSKMKTKCENDISSSDQDLDTFLRVTDNVTGHTYFNKYCATCNGAFDLVRWNLSVDCYNYMTVYKADSPDQLFKLSLSSYSGCFVSQTPPDNISPYDCHRRWFGVAVVDTCNETGEWDTYDKDIVRACEDISETVNHVRIKKYFDNLIYKNLFCALCNLKGYPKISSLHCPQSQLSKKNNMFWRTAVKIRLPFSILLNFGTQISALKSEPDFTKCSPISEWVSQDNLCFPLQCAPGKVLINNTCSTALNQIRGLIYQIRVLYVPIASSEIGYNIEDTKVYEHHTSDIHRKYLDRFRNQIKAILSDVMEEFEVTVAMIFSDQIRNLQNWWNETETITNSSQIGFLSRNFKIMSFSLYGFLLGNRSLNRDQVERIIVTELITKSIILEMEQNKSLILAPVITPNKRQQQLDCTSVQTQRLSCVSDSLSQSNSFSHTSEIDREHSIVIEHHLNCAFVSFNSTEYLYESNNSSCPHNISITLYVSQEPVTISEAGELNMVSIAEDETLSVCHELLNMKTKNSFRGDAGKNNLLLLSQYFLTLICLSSSILCLAFTLMTYFLFRVLRSVAGKNNMFLCGSLLLAQASLLAISHVKQNGHLCVVLAIFTHLLWLSMFCWCFTCCFHMYQIFTAKTRNVQGTASSERIFIVKRVVACSVVPALIVICVVVTNYFTNEGKLSGYGKTTCFLDSPKLIVITVVTPLCLILLCNTFFFAVTIIKIHYVRKLQVNNLKKDDQNNLYIYIKLSSMTGMFWILAVISEATDNDPLRFIAICLNGLQGVFIFLSYICNKRVLKLYMRALGFEKVITRTSTSGRSTLANVVADKDIPYDKPQVTAVEDSMAMSFESNAKESSCDCKI